MSCLVFKKGEFKIVDQILSHDTFEEWIDQEGRTVLYDIMKYKKMRWFFGKRRARRTLYRAAKTALKSHSPFAILLEPQLNQLPIIIRKIGIIIKRRGYKDLYSASSTRALFVIPRGIAQHDFRHFILKELLDAPQLEGFWGLSKRILKEVSLEAEQLFFNLLIKGRQYTDPEGKGILLGVDPDYKWKLNGMDGHYYFAYFNNQNCSLDKRKTLNQFKSEMEEVLYGQKIHLKRLESHQVFDIAESFRVQNTVKL